MAIVMIEGPGRNAEAQPAHAAVQASLDARAQAAGQALHRYRCATEQQLLERLARINREEADVILLDPGACARPGAPLQQALAGLDVPYIEVRGVDADPGAGRSGPRVAAGAGPRLGVIDGYAAQGFTLAMSMALETLGCAESENDVHVGT